MPVPSLVTDLSTTIASNSPAGSDNVFPDLDNYLRSLSGFLASIRDNSGNGWVSPYLPLAGGTVTGATTFSSTVALNGALSGTGLTTYLASPPAIGGTAAAAVSSTNLSYTGTLTGGTGIVALGTNQFYKDASGNIGLGTASPAQKLELVGDFQQQNANYIRGRLAAGTSSRLFGLNASNSLYIGGIDAAQSETLFVRGGTVQATLDSAGNLGLGVTPSAWGGGFKAFQFGLGTLSNNNTGDFTNVASNAYYDGSVWRYIGATTASRYTQLVGQHLWYTAPSGTAGNTITFTQAMTLDASGRLGIGNTSPARPLDVLGTASGVAIFKNSTTAGFAEVSISSDDRSFAIGQRSSTNAGGDLAYLYSGTATPIAFFTNTQERARITSGGTLLVGTISQIGSVDDRLQVNTATAGARASVFKNATSDTDTIGAWNAGTTGNNKFVQFYTEAGASVRGSIDYNRAGGLVVYNTTSDYRAKDIIGPVQDSGATIDALKIYEGQMKGATQSRPMLVAHEAQVVAPYSVTGEKDAVNDDGTPKFQQMDVSSLVPLLIAEIQSLRARVASLETQP